MFTHFSEIRSRVVNQILMNFKKSMPIYAQMMEVADAINSQAGAKEAERLGKIMHGAIRCANNEELQTVSDIFELMGNQPVNYYDLREKVSVESTAFRPTCKDEIEKNGFRIFCSRLSMDCIPQEHHEFVLSLMSRRKLFDDELLKLIRIGKEQGGLKPAQADQFVQKCVQLFLRPEKALLTMEEFKKLQSINKVAAQILITNSLALNHLTPSVASVPRAHEEMQRRGITTIPVWQGPVGKNVVLRQTSCLAPPVKLQFPTAEGSFIEADYQETFVEFEERLQALTPKGRLLFEDLFNDGKKSLSLSENDDGYAEHYYQTMHKALSEFPEDPMTLYTQKLAYFTFDKSDPTESVSESNSLNENIISGRVKLVPQQYEDFFGPAATNIFNSNIGLKDVSNVAVAKPDSQKTFESGLGRSVVNMYDYYSDIQNASAQAICPMEKV